MRIESYRVRKNSGGRGAHRGGDGIVREFRFLTGPAEVTILFRIAPALRGAYMDLAGGEAGESPVGIRCFDAGGNRRRFPPRLGSKLLLTMC